MASLLTSGSMRIVVAGMFDGMAEPLLVHLVASILPPLRGGRGPVVHVGRLHVEHVADADPAGAVRELLLASIYFSPVSLNRRAVRAKAASPLALTYFHRFRSRLDGPVPRQVLQPVGSAGYLDQVAVVAHPVRDRARRHVVPEHPASAADPHVGGDDRRALLVARRYQLEQQVRARAADVEVAELVDDQQPRVGVVLEPLLEDAARRGVLLDWLH